MEVRTELHFHILPGVDDGPRDMDEAVEVGRLAVADGTSVLTATPHVHALLSQAILAELPERVAAVQRALDSAGIALEVRTGAELAQDDLAELDDDQLDLIAHGPAGNRWVLIEAPLFADANDYLLVTAELRERGFGTLIGHPERCDQLMEMTGALAAEKEAGARLQLNASSLTGRHGDNAREWGIELVRSGAADVLASDAHLPTRPPVLTPALAVLAEAGIPAERLEPMVVDAPRRLLAEGIAPPQRNAKSRAA